MKIMISLPSSMLLVGIILATIGNAASAFTTSTPTAQQQQQQQQNQQCLNAGSCVDNDTADRHHSENESNKSGQRNIQSLSTWASEKSIHLSPAISFIENHNDNNEDDNDDDNNVGLTVNQSLPKTTKVLTVPKSMILDSHQILKEWEDLLQPSIHHLETTGTQTATNPSSSHYQLDEDAKFNFALNVKILHEYSLGTESKWYTWLHSLPKLHQFSTGIMMDKVELSVLPPFGVALADYQIKKLGVFREALDILWDTLKEKKDGEGKDLWRGFNIHGDHDGIDSQLSLWAFNVVQTRCWGYGQETEENGDTEWFRPLMVPVGDMLNHHEPPNVVVDDSPDSESVDFILIEDVQVDDNDTSGQQQGLFLSYGLNNPYRFLIIFGFFDSSMPQIFSEVLFSNPSPELLALGCNDRSKMLYRTTDGAISNTVWDTVLYSLLDQSPEDQVSFYQAHVDGDNEAKAAIHDRFVMESCLSLRKHVMKTLGELGEVLREIDAMYREEGNSSVVDKEHPRLSMIRRHNVFLYHAFDKVRQRIEAEAKKELERRKKAQSIN